MCCLLAIVYIDLKLTCEFWLILKKQTLLQIFFARFLPWIYLRRSLKVLEKFLNFMVFEVWEPWFQHAWTSLSTTMFKLASSTMFKPVNRQKQVVRFYICMWSQSATAHGHFQAIHSFCHLQTKFFKINISLQSKVLFRSYALYIYLPVCCH